MKPSYWFRKVEMVSFDNEVKKKWERLNNKDCVAMVTKNNNYTFVFVVDKGKLFCFIKRKDMFRVFGIDNTEDIRFHMNQPKVFEDNDLLILGEL